MSLPRALSIPAASCSLRFAPTAILLTLAALPAAAQNQAWIRQLGTSAGDSASAAAPDGLGGVYVSGRTFGSLGGLNAGYEDAWLAHYDGAGNQLWIRQLGTSVFDLVNAAAPDGSGGVYVGGHTGGSLGGTNAGSSDAWLARYDGAGNQLWISQLGTSTDDRVYAAAPDGAGGLYVGGSTHGSLGGSSAGGDEAWLARYDSTGNQLWIRQLGTSTDERVYGAAADGSGGVYVSGPTRGSLGGTNAGYEDVWLSRYDSAGNQLWIRQLGTSLPEYAFTAAPDGSGGTYVGGITAGSLGGSNAGGFDAWLARYDGAGNQLWIRQLGTSGSEQLTSAARGEASGVYVAGYTDGGLGGLSAGGFDAWMARYDAAGNQLWIRQLGTAFQDRAYAAAPDGSGSLYVGGYTSGSIAGFAGNLDAWLARYDGSCGASSNYCTAKANSAGCVPSIGASGTPSATAGSGFIVSTSNVLDNKLGLYFYSKSGPNAAPFQGGTLCCGPLLVRAPLQSSGGSPPCGGSYKFDFNAWIATGADPALIAGQQVWMQTWSRDPGFAAPKNIGLSDAVTFSICP
jgi:uncharacterized lipoprotein YmbA